MKRGVKQWVHKHRLAIMVMGSLSIMLLVATGYFALYNNVLCLSSTPDWITKLAQLCLSFIGTAVMYGFGFWHQFCYLYSEDSYEKF